MPAKRTSTMKPYLAGTRYSRTGLRKCPAEQAPIQDPSPSLLPTRHRWDRIILISQTERLSYSFSYRHEISTQRPTFGGSDIRPRCPVWKILCEFFDATGL